MNPKSYRPLVVAALMVIILAISACGTLRIESEPAASQVEPTAIVTESAGPGEAAEETDAATMEPVASEAVVEATAEPLALVGYSNEETGISFTYPTSWAMEEEANAFLFRRGTVILRVGYRMVGDSADLSGRTGMGGTGVSALEGTVPFLGQSLARYGVYYDDLLMAVVYGGEPGDLVQSGAMQFVIILDDPESDYQTLALTDDVLAEAEMILASFEVGSSQGGPVAGLETYTNSEYGFALNYPSTWTVAEVNGDDFVGPGSHSVQFSQGTVKLVVGYRRLGESVAISGSGAPGGEFEIRGTVHVAGRDVDRHVIAFEGKDKVVMYSESGTPISAAGLEFAPRLDDFAQVTYEDVELSQSVQDEADMILSSLALIDSEQATTGYADGYDYTGWLPYTNEGLGYSLMYPSDVDIMGAIRDESVEFVGPVNGSDHWPWFSVQHFDSPFFNPPPGTDVGQWIADSNISYASDAQTATIGGLPAVHFRVEQSPQAYGMDEYYVINGGQLYKITILHAGGIEDWELYDQFLQSFAFGGINE